MRGWPPPSLCCRAGRFQRPRRPRCYRFARPARRSGSGSLPRPASARVRSQQHAQSVVQPEIAGESLLPCPQQPLHRLPLFGVVEVANQVQYGQHRQLLYRRRARQLRQRDPVASQHGRKPALAECARRRLSGLQHHRQLLLLRPVWRQLPPVVQGRQKRFAHRAAEHTRRRGGRYGGVHSIVP